MAFRRDRVARGGHAVSRQGPGSGTGRGQARGARVGTCAGTRGRECRGAAALYRAARSELQRGRRLTASGLGRPTPGRPSASWGRQCPAWRGVTASGAEAPDARALSPTCFLPLPLLKAAAETPREHPPPPPPPCRPRESCVVETDARGRQYQTWGRVCSPIPGDFHFQSLHSKMQSSLQRSALKLSNSVEKQLYPTYMFYFVFPTDFIYI